MAAYYGGLSLDDTTFDLVIVPAAGVSLAEAEEAMDQVLAGVLRDGVSTDHLERIKKQVRAAEVYARDDAGDIANRYGRGLSVGLTIEDVQAWPDILQSVSEEDILAAAQEIFTKETSVTGWLTAPEVTQ